MAAQGKSKKKRSFGRRWAGRLIKLAAAIVAAAIGLVLILAAGAMYGLDQLASAATPSAYARATIPAKLLSTFKSAAEYATLESGGESITWSLLAGVAYEESGGFTSRGISAAGAVGLMQMIPSANQSYLDDLANVKIPGGATPPSFANTPDAVYAAALKLEADGVARGELSQALGLYNCGSAWLHDQRSCIGTVGYISAVLGYAQAFQAGYDTTGATQTQLAVLALAESELGTPYVWGGEGATGFDCSGLVQWSFAGVGVGLPRVAQDQYDAGPLVSADTPLVPGDLVFFADANGYIAHVGIYAGNDTMIDAPHTGAFVRYDQFNPTPGAAWGDEYYTGATDPGGAFVVPASTQPAR